MRQLVRVTWFYFGFTVADLPFSSVFKFSSSFGFRTFGTSLRELQVLPSDDTLMSSSSFAENSADIEAIWNKNVLTELSRRLHSTECCSEIQFPSAFLRTLPATLEWIFLCSCYSDEKGNRTRCRVGTKRHVSVFGG